MTGILIQNQYATMILPSFLIKEVPVTKIHPWNSSMLIQYQSLGLTSYTNVLKKNSGWLKKIKLLCDSVKVYRCTYPNHSTLHQCQCNTNPHRKKNMTGTMEHQMHSLQTFFVSQNKGIDIIIFEEETRYIQNKPWIYHDVDDGDGYLILTINWILQYKLLQQIRYNTHQQKLSKPLVSNVIGYISTKLISICCYA